MARMIIEFDEERMERDGIDVNNAWEQIEEIRKIIPETEKNITKLSQGCFSGEFGHVFFFENQLEKQEWIMKYVKKWLFDFFGDGEYDDLIESIRETGRKCCYE